MRALRILRIHVVDGDRFYPHLPATVLPIGERLTQRSMNKDRYSDFRDRVLCPVEDFADSPLLKSINWNGRTLITIIRAGLMDGHYDTTAKAWLTSKAAIQEILDDRNRKMASRTVDPNEL